MGEDATSTQPASVALQAATAIKLGLRQTRLEIEKVESASKVDSMRGTAILLKCVSVASQATSLFCNQSERATQTFKANPATGISNGV